MPYEIVWSDEARCGFNANIRFLEKKWSDEEALNFIERTEKILSLLENHPALFPITRHPDKNIRKGAICRQVSLIYKVEEDAVFLMKFWNNLQDPEKLDLD